MKQNKKGMKGRGRKKCVCRKCSGGMPDWVVPGRFLPSEVSKTTERVCHDRAVIGVMGTLGELGVGAIDVRICEEG